MAVPLVNLLTLLAKIPTGSKVGARDLTGHGNQIKGGRQAEDVAGACRRPHRAAGVGAPDDPLHWLQGFCKQEVDW